MPCRTRGHGRRSAATIRPFALLPEISSLSLPCLEAGYSSTLDWMAQRRSSAILGFLTPPCKAAEFSWQANASPASSCSDDTSSVSRMPHPNVSRFFGIDSLSFVLQPFCAATFRGVYYHLSLRKLEWDFSRCSIRGHPACVCQSEENRSRVTDSHAKGALDCLLFCAGKRGRSLILPPNQSPVTGMQWLE